MNSIVEFLVAAALTLATSVVLVTRLERVGKRLGFTQAILGLVTALAANTPEITSAITALSRGQREVGVSVVLGSNVFNLAALIGLGALVAGRIDLHRRVILLVGTVSLWISVVSMGAVTNVVPAWISLILALAVMIPYIVLSAWPHLPRRLGIGKPTRTWLRETISEEESETAEAIHPTRGTWRDGLIAVGALVVVVFSSVVMEHAASSFGTRFGWSSIVIGGIVLAGVTSLPNAVAGVYFAARGLGSALLSEALNSNNLNAVVGFMIPAVIVGLHDANTPAIEVVWFYFGLTFVTLTLALVRRGFTRWSGGAIIVGYLAFVFVIAR
jgi:cation:H+ antiporter